MSLMMYKLKQHLGKSKFDFLNPLFLCGCDKPLRERLVSLSKIQLLLVLKCNTQIETRVVWEVMWRIWEESIHSYSIHSIINS